MFDPAHFAPWRKQMVKMVAPLRRVRTFPVAAHRRPGENAFAAHAAGCLGFRRPNRLQRLHDKSGIDRQRPWLASPARVEVFADRRDPSGVLCASLATQSGRDCQAGTIWRRARALALCLAVRGSQVNIPFHLWWAGDGNGLGQFGGLSCGGPRPSPLLSGLCSTISRIAALIIRRHPRLIGPAK
jgi:hypothetical protein